MNVDLCVDVCILLSGQLTPGRETKTYTLITSNGCVQHAATTYISLCVVVYVEDILEAPTPPSLVYQLLSSRDKPDKSGSL